MKKKTKKKKTTTTKKSYGWKFRQVDSRLGQNMGVPEPSDEAEQGQQRYQPLPRGREEDPYARKWYDWGRRVRRDILVLEYYLQLLNRKQPRRQKIRIELYKDPGDPPPPPNGIQ